MGPRVCRVHSHKGSSKLKLSLIVTRLLIFTFIRFIMDNSEEVTVPTNLKVYQYFNNYQAKGKKKKVYFITFTVSSSSLLGYLPFILPHF